MIKFRVDPVECPKSFRRFGRRVVIGLLCVLAMVWPCGAQSLSWSWSNPLPHGNDVVGMAWNGTLGVQVCEAGQIYTSPDLVNWTPQKSNLTNDLQAVTFFGKRIVVTGAYGAVAYSDDGTNFFASSLNTANWLVSVAASPTLVVTVGDNGALYTSTNGAVWKLQAPPPDLEGNWLDSVACGNSTFVITGDYGYIATSSNGSDWNPTSIDADTYGDLENVAWYIGSGSTTAFPYKGFWIVTDTDTGSGDSYALYSVNNGANWTQVSFANPSTNTLFTVAADNSTALLAGDAEARLGSDGKSGITWPEQVGSSTNDVPPGAYYASVLQSNGVYVLAGADGMLAESYTNSTGYNWNEPWYSPRDWLWQVTVANGLYVAVGDNARIMTSDDGAAWTVEEVANYSATNPANPLLLCVGGATNLLLAAGTGGTLLVSPYTLNPVLDTNSDGSLSTNYVSSLGVAWHTQSPPTGTTNDLAGIGMFNNKFFLVGGNGTLLNSPDGTNWTKVNPGTSNYISGITGFTNRVSTNALLVLTGNEGTLLTSTNGTSWARVTVDTTNWLYRVHCFNGRLLAFGENGTLLTSTNGTVWTLLNSGVTNWLNDAVMVSNTCYVVGNQGMVLASTNFVNWSKAGTITSKALESAATQDGQLVVVGFEGSILRSQIIPEPVNFLQYAQAGGYNLFSVTGPVEQQFTLDSSTNLVNWVTGPLLDMIYGDGTLIFYETAPADSPRDQYYRCTLVP
jgi:hypothetical protein